MDSVTESNMAQSLAREGGIGIIHRFMTIQDQVTEVLKVKRSESVIIEQPYTIGPYNTVREDLASIMLEKGISGLLVEDDDRKLCGIITQKDIVFEKNPNLKVSDLMTKDVIFANAGITIEQAKEILHKNKVEKLPILDARKKNNWTYNR